MKSSDKNVTESIIPEKYLTLDTITFNIPNKTINDKAVIRVLDLGLRSFINSCMRLLKLARKPGRGELWLSIKICILGILVVGILAFLIKLISGVLQGFM